VLSIEARALLRPEVGFLLRTVLCVAGEVATTASTADGFATGTEGYQSKIYLDIR